jgi:hypothetical protein
VVPWITSDSSEPDTIYSANFAPGRLLSLRSRGSAAYKGIYALLMREGGLDFRTGDTISDQRYFDEKVDIHHIFPQDYCKKKKIEAKLCDSMVNKTPLSKRTNIKIGGKAPSVYLPLVQKEASINQERMDQILRTHLIDPAILRSDDFNAFFRAREEALLTAIEKAMGKPIARDVVETPSPEPVDYQTEYEEEAVA